MPLHEDGYLIPYDEAAISEMEIETLDVRQGGHPVETRELGQNTMRRAFSVKWEERFNFCTLVCGDEVTWNDAGVTKLSRLLPDDYYGRHPEFSEIVAERIESIKGHGGPGIDDDNGMPAYPKARVDVLYSHLPYALAEDDAIASEFERYVEEGPTQGDADYVTMPGSVLKFIRESGTGDPHLFPLPYNVGFTQPTEQFEYTWHRLPEECWGPGSNLYVRVYEGDGDDVPYVGTINSSSLPDGRPTGTCLLLGVTPRKMRAASGVGFRWSLTFRWSYKPGGHTWFRFFDPVTPANSGLYFVGTGTTHHYANTLPDNYSVFNVRDHAAKLFDID